MNDKVFNLSQYVRVRLYEEGFKVWHKEFLNHSYYGRSFEEHCERFKVADGYYQFQMYRFMNIFGADMEQQQFKLMDNNVLIFDKDLTDRK
jgi:hypothetical protein